MSKARQAIIRRPSAFRYRMPAREALIEQIAAHSHWLAGTVSLGKWFLRAETIQAKRNAAVPGGGCTEKSSSRVHGWCTGSGISIMPELCTLNRWA